MLPTVKEKEEWLPHYYKTNDGITCMCTSTNLCHVCTAAQKQPSGKYKENSDLLLRASEESISQVEKVCDVKTLLAEQMKKWAQHYYKDSDGNLHICTLTAICEACALDAKNRMRDGNELCNKEVTDCAPNLDFYCYNSYPSIHIHNNILPPTNANSNPSIDIHVNNSHQNIEIHNNILPPNYNCENQTITTKENLRVKLNKDSKRQFIDLNDLNTRIYSNIPAIDPQSSTDMSMSKEQFILNDGMCNIENDLQDQTDGVNYEGGSKEFPGKEKMVVKFPFKRKSPKEVLCRNIRTSDITPQLLPSSNDKSSDSLIPDYLQDHISPYECASVGTSSSSCSSTTKHTTSLDEHTDHANNNVWSLGNNNKLSSGKINLANETFLNDIGGSGWVIDADDDNMYILDRGNIRVISTKTYKENSNDNVNKVVENSSGYLNQNMTPEAKDNIDDNFNGSNNTTSNATCTNDMERSISPMSAEISQLNKTFIKGSDNENVSGTILPHIPNTIEHSKASMSQTLSISSFPAQENIKLMPKTRPSLEEKESKRRSSKRVGTNIMNQNKVAGTKPKSKPSSEKKKEAKEQSSKSKCVSTDLINQNKIAGTANNNVNDNKTVAYNNNDNTIMINNEVHTNDTEESIFPVGIQIAQPNTVSEAHITETNNEHRNGALVSNKKVTNVLVKKNGKQGNCKDIKRKKMKKKDMKENESFTAEIRKEAKTVGKPSLILKVSDKTIAPIKTKLKFTEILKRKIAAEIFNKCVGTDKVRRKYVTEDVRTAKLQTLDVSPRVILHCLLEDTRSQKMSPTKLETSQNPRVNEGSGSKKVSVKQHRQVVSKRKDKDNISNNMMHKKHCKNNTAIYKDSKNGKDNKFKNVTRGGKSNSIQERKMLLHSRKLPKRKIFKREVGKETFIDLTTIRRYSVVKRHLAGEVKVEVLDNSYTVDKIGEKVEKTEANNTADVNITPNKCQISLSELNMNLKVTLHDVFVSEKKGIIGFSDEFQQ